ncbi:MAG: flagellar FliJ family protein [Planctomycetes bacterium]|nr:flagellar FliJ family protein [Planctomycetota bacterium]
MRRFRFRLQSVLRLRSQLERSARTELAAAMADVNALDQQLLAAGQGVRECAEHAVRGDAVGQLARQLELGLRRHQWRLQKKRKDAERHLDSVRVDYAAKAREKRTVERLREEEHDAWRRDVQRQEQAELDETALLTAPQRAQQREGGA